MSDQQDRLAALQELVRDYFAAIDADDQNEIGVVGSLLRAAGVTAPPAEPRAEGLREADIEPFRRGWESGYKAGASDTQRGMVKDGWTRTTGSGAAATTSAAPVTMTTRTNSEPRCRCGKPESAHGDQQTRDDHAFVVAEPRAEGLRKALRAFGERLAADGYGWEAIITREGPIGEVTVAHLTTSNPDPDRLASQPTPAPLEVVDITGIDAIEKALIERLRSEGWSPAPLDVERRNYSKPCSADRFCCGSDGHDGDHLYPDLAQQDTPEPRPLPIETREGLGPR